MKEVWKGIQGFEDLYQISNFGRVKSLSRVDKLTQRDIADKILKPSFDRNKYLLVWLCRDGKQTVKKVHRLVGQHFIPNPDNLPCINHKDENPSNNMIENLEWCTYKYNNNYGTSIYRMARTLGKPVIQKTLNGDVVNTYYAAIEAERQTGIPNTHINKCCHGTRKTAGKFKWEFAPKSEAVSI